MTVLVDDYSTETGLRVRITCDTTGTVVQIPADEWLPFLEHAKAGVYDDLAKGPKIPYVHWPEGAKLPIVGGGTVGEG